MKLESLNIRPSYSFESDYREGCYRGEVKYSGSSGCVVLNLTPELATKILAVVADDLVVASKEVAERLTSQILTSPKTTENLIGQTQDSDVPF